MTQTPDDGTNEELARLRAENERLRADASHPPATAPRGPRWRSAVSAVLIILATLVAPAAVVASWAKVELTSTDAFVRTFGPLASDPAVQQLVADRVVQAVDEQVDIDGLTKQAFDAIAGLNVPPRAKAALQTLEAPAAAGIKSLISSSVNDFVRSDAFADAWTQALRTTHSQLLARANRSPQDQVVTVDNSGRIGIQLAPLIDQVKTRLVARGVPLASQIPEVNRTIVVATASQAPKIRTAYNAAVQLGIWLPILALVLLVAGVLSANHRRRTLVVATCAITAIMVLTGIALAVARAVLASQLASDQLPADAVRAMYTQATVMLRSSVLAVAVIAAATALVAWWCAPGGVPLRLRGFATNGASAVRATAERQGLTTGRFGLWLYAQRNALLWVLALISVVVLVLSRPVSVSTLVWLGVVDLVLVALLLLLQRPERRVPEVVAGTA